MSLSAVKSTSVFVESFLADLSFTSGKFYNTLSQIFSRGFPGNPSP